MTPTKKPASVPRASMETEAYARSGSRRKKIETLFGDAERNLGPTRHRLRGLSGAGDEFLLTATRAEPETAGQTRHHPATQTGDRLIHAPTQRKYRPQKQTPPRQRSAAMEIRPLQAIADTETVSSPTF